MKEKNWKDLTLVALSICFYVISYTVIEISYFLSLIPSTLGLVCLYFCSIFDKEK